MLTSSLTLYCCLHLARIFVFGRGYCFRYSIIIHRGMVITASSFMFPSMSLHRFCETVQWLDYVLDYGLSMGLWSMVGNGK